MENYKLIEKLTAIECDLMKISMVYEAKRDSATLGQAE